LKPRVVFDVNILVSAVVSPHGAPARAYAGALEHSWDICRSYHIVSTVIDVLGRPRFQGRLPSTRLNRFVMAYQDFAIPFTPDPSIRGIAPDAEDDLVLGTAVAAEADFLVTGDKGLLALDTYGDIRIVTAEEFLAHLEGLT
jgi:hypothetical protein